MWIFIIFDKRQKRNCFRHIISWILSALFRFGVAFNSFWLFIFFFFFFGDTYEFFSPFSHGAASIGWKKTKKDGARETKKWREGAFYFTASSTIAKACWTGKSSGNYCIEQCSFTLFILPFISSFFPRRSYKSTLRYKMQNCIYSLPFFPFFAKGEVRTTGRVAKNDRF